MKLVTPRLLTAALLLGSASTLNAASISVNFGSNEGGGSLASATEAAGAISVSSPNWNNASGAAGTLGTLKDSSGVTTAATITWSSANTWRSSAADVVGNDNGILTKGYLDDGASGYSGTIGGTGYFSSNVYLILASDSDATATTNITLGGYSINGTVYGWNGSATVAGVASWATANSWSQAATLTEGSNYIKVSDLVGPVSFTGVRPTGGRSALAGIQVEDAFTGTYSHWDTNGSTAGAGGATPSGSWDSAISNWTTDSSGSSATTTFVGANSAAVFSAGSDATGTYAITVSGTQDARGLWFKNGNVTLTGGTVNLINERGIRVDSGNQVVENLTATGDLNVMVLGAGSTLTFTNALSGAMGMGVSGAGKLILLGANTHSGTTTIAAGGTVQVGNAGTTGALGTGAVVNNGTLAFNRTDATTITNTISGSGKVEVNSGTVAFSTQKTYTGGTTVSGTGTVLNLTGGAGASGTIRGTATVNSGATLRLSTGDATGYNGGASALTVINLNGGTLDINTASNQTLGSAVINMTGGAITGIANSNLDFFGGGSALNTLASGTTSTISGTKLTLRQGGGATFTVASGTTGSGIDLDIASVVTNGGYGAQAFTKAGAGTLRLTGVNNYTGATNINAGKIITGNTAALGATTAVTIASGATLQVGDGNVNTVTLASGATLAVNGTLKFNEATSALTLQGTGGYTLASGSILDLNSAFNVANTYNLISGGSGTKTDGAFTFTGADTTNFNFAFSQGILTVTAIPEPSTYGLMGAGALVAVALVRRRRAAKVA